MCSTIMVYRTASVSLMAHSHCTGPGQGIDQETMSFYIALCVHTTQGQSCGKVMFLHLSVSHSVHRGGGCLGRHPPPHPRQTPPSPPQADTCQSFCSQGSVWPDTPQTPLQRTVRILVECILVFYCVHPGPSPVQCVSANRP